MTDEAQHSAWTLIYDHRQWMACCQDERWVWASDEEAFLPKPELPDGSIIQNIIFPLESLLVRTFQLPLAHPRLIDENILSQEVEDMTGDKADQWWFCWEAGEFEDGVRGLLLGLPMAWLQSMQTADWCEAVPTVTSDAVFRLMRWNDSADGRIAVLDEDESGLFIGVREKRCWRGMRRLNGKHHDGMMLEEVLATLKAMGWQEKDPVCGQLSDATLKACAFENWKGSVCDSLPDRLAETHLAAEGGIPPVELNFRRGKWQPSHPLFELQVWKRPLLMLLILLLVWGAGQGYQWWSLQRMTNAYETRVMTAFRSALPTDPVIDPLAQLQRAAGSHGGGTQSTTVLLHNIHILSQVYAANPWIMKELQYNGKKFEIRGEIRGLKQLNQLQRRLSRKLERNVEIADTELGKNKVSFRMVWS